jgi:pSer/pThr/pTyr-binding forkhead associated (FHA) protein
MPELLVSNADGDTIAECPVKPRAALTVGRSDGNDLIVPVDSVSRRHVLVFDHAGTWFAADLGSRLGLENDRGSTRFHAFTGDDSWVQMGPAYLWLVGAPPPPARIRTSLLPTAQPSAVNLPHDFGKPETEFPPASATPQPCFLAFSRKNEPTSRLVDLTLVDRLIIGRDPSCDLIIDDPDVSRLHAVIYREGSRFVIADAGSSKGLRVDGSRWLRKRLEPNTLLQFGSIVARVVVPESPVAPISHDGATEDDPLDLGSIFEEPGTWAPITPKQPRGV